MLPGLVPRRAPSEPLWSLLMCHTPSPCHVRRCQSVAQARVPHGPRCVCGASVASPGARSPHAA
jgi:hypothetical protein